MIEIDNLQRITLRDLKPYFDLCKRLKGEVEEHTKEKTLAERIDLAERNFYKIEHLLRWDITFTRTTPLGEFKKVLNVEAVIDPLDIEIVAFLFRWESDGEKKEMRITLETAPSNLGLSPVRYFVCPYTHKRCRKLYTDWDKFASRWAFPHTYSQRNYSHKWRENKKVIDLTLFVENEATSAKREWYGGKLTRYGRKLKKMAGGETYEQIKAKMEAGILALWSSPRRGRPSKPESEKSRGRKPTSPPLFIK